MRKIRAFFQELRHSEEGRYGVGVAGFCWGGYFAVKLSHNLITDDNKPLVDAGFTAHPGNLKLPADLEKTKKPTSLAIGDQDSILPVDKVEQVREIWRNLDNDVDTEIIVYPGAGHGFAVRSDPSNMKLADQSAESEAQAVRWFEKHFETLAQ
jgi:dienelactone hydrolase